MTWTIQMILKNVSILFLGVALGMIIITVFYGYMFHRVKKVKTLKDISAMKLKCGETTHIFMNPNTTQESVELLLLLLLIYMFFHTGKHISAKDAKRTKRMMYFVFITIFITVIILIVLSVNVSLPPVAQ